MDLSVLFSVALAAVESDSLLTRGHHNSWAQLFSFAKIFDNFVKDTTTAVTLQ